MKTKNVLLILIVSFFISIVCVVVSFVVLMGVISIYNNTMVVSDNLNAKQIEVFLFSSKNKQLNTITDEQANKLLNLFQNGLVLQKCLTNEQEQLTQSISQSSSYIFVKFIQPLYISTNGIEGISVDSIYILQNNVNGYELLIQSNVLENPKIVGNYSCYGWANTK
jgi:hypothetical protein